MPIDKTEYFEGEIEYDITYESLHPTLNSEDFAKDGADSKIQQFKDGNFVSQSFKNDTLIGRSWFDKSVHRVYIQMVKSDTIYFYDTRNVDFIVEPFKVTNGQSILNYSTQKVELTLKGKDSIKFSPNESMFVYHIATDLAIEPSWYKDFLEFDMDKIFTAVPGTILKEEDIIWNVRKLTKTATRVEHKSIELDLSVDPTKTLIEI